MHLIKEFAIAKSIHELMTSRSINGRPDFDALDAMIASASSTPFLCLFAVEWNVWPSGQSSPDTGNEPKFCTDVSDGHFPHDYDASVANAEDVDVPRHPGDSSRTKHTGASIQQQTRFIGKWPHESGGGFRFC